MVDLWDFRSRRDIPFDVDMLTDQLIYWIKINRYGLYKAFNKIPGPARKDVLNQIGQEIAAVLINKVTDAVPAGIEINNEEELEG